MEQLRREPRMTAQGRGNRGQARAHDAAEPPSSVACIENAAGPSTIVLICEHASNRIPSQYGDLGLTAEERENHIAWDPGALGVARGLSRLLDAPLVHANVSRLVLDLNRDPSAPDSITTLSELTPVPGNVDLSASDRLRRVDEVYHSFHDAADALIERRVATGRTRAVVSIHSFTPIYRGVSRPWHVGLIFNRDERLARFVGSRLVERAAGLVVGMNEPYSPADRVFHTLERHAERRGLAPLMIEIRNDLIRDRDQQETWSDRLAPLLNEAVGQV
jgi:predicted N-formylglutamate amidohydrolase